MIDWNKQQLIVFDMDGTLYEGREHYDYYARLIMEDIVPHKQADYWADYNAVMNNAHPMQIGMVYDTVRDVGIILDADGWHIKGVVTWTGEQWSQTHVNQVYGEEALVPNDETHISIGDAWWVPFMVGCHYGNATSGWKKYSETKRYFNEIPGRYSIPLGLTEALRTLATSHTLVCLTNSDEADMEVTLQALGLGDVFHETIGAAKKPRQTAEHFQRLSESYGVPYEAMTSIGDNYLNEIAPALALGMQAVHIWPYAPSIHEGNLWRVQTLADFADAHVNNVK
ncbi:MAG: HAD family hydrolase [Bacilli bacterium]